MDTIIPSNDPPAKVARPPASESHLTYLSLPLELRNIIYGLLLTLNKPIVIRSPRTKAVANKYWHMRPKHKTDVFRAIFMVNRQTYTEASRVFYSSNRFTVGNGEYASTFECNTHGLAAFLRRTPAALLACIQKVDIIPLLRHQQWWESDETSGWDEQWAHIYDQPRPTDEEEEEFELMADTVAKKLKNVQSIRIRIYPRWMTHLNEVNYNSYNAQTVVRAVQRLMKMPHLKEIHLTNWKDFNCQRLLDKLVEVDPEAGRMVKVLGDDLEAGATERQSFGIATPGKFLLPFQIDI